MNADPNTPTPRLEIIPLRPATRADGETRLEVLLRIHAPEAAQPERPRLNLALALDRSGSMAVDKIRKAREAAAFVVGQLAPHDRVALVAYDSAVEVVLASTPAADKGALLAAIDRIHARGNTDLFGGWREAARQAAAHLEPAALNRVLLLTDGLANEGLTDPGQIAAHVGELARRGVSTTTLGVGRDFNEDLLSRMADHGEGNFHFIESVADLPRIFALELSGLSATFAQRLRLKVQGEGLRVELHNEYSVNDHGQYRLPELIAGRPLEVGLCLTAPAGPLAAEFCLNWDDAAGQRQRVSVSFALEAVPSTVYEGLPENRQVLAYLAKLEATHARREAMAALDRGDPESALSSLTVTSAQLRKYLDYYPEELAELEGLSRDIRSDQNVARKKMTSQSLRNLKGKQ